MIQKKINSFSVYSNGLIYKYYNKSLYNKDKLNLVRDAFIPSQMSYINDRISYHSGSQKYYDEIYKENYQNII